VFHDAFPVVDLTESLRFYGGVLRCPTGVRANGDAVDVDVFGHHTASSSRLSGALARRRTKR
jgi:extradiol dioxygenase family protein